MIIWPCDCEELGKVEMEYIWTYQPRNRATNKLLVGVGWAFVIEVGLLALAYAVLRLLGVL